MLLRSDPMCRDLRIEQSWITPEVIRVQVDFSDVIGISPQSYSIIQRRYGEAMPIVALSFQPRTHVLMDAEHQEGQPLQIGSQVCIDENGRIGAHGTPIGVLMLINEGGQAQIAVYGSDGGAPPPQQDHHLGVSFANFRRMPLPTVDAQVLRAREQIMAAEDARIFEALDAAIGVQNDLSRESKAKPPESRPTVKTRYERILESFEK
jgi:hypothetical protein